MCVFICNVQADRRYTRSHTHTHTHEYTRTHKHTHTRTHTHTHIHTQHRLIEESHAEELEEFTKKEQLWFPKIQMLTTQFKQITDKLARSKIEVTLLLEQVCFCELSARSGVRV